MKTFRSIGYNRARNQKFSCPLLAVVLITGCLPDLVQAADEGALVFAGSQRAVVRIFATVPEEQIEFEKQQLRERFTKEFLALARIQEKNRDQKDSAIPISDENAVLKTIEKALEDLDNSWEKRWKAHEQQIMRPRQMGMGVVIDPEGYVLTCANIVKGATWPGTKLSVMDYKNRSFGADIYAQDEGTNLLLLKIPTEACTSVVTVKPDLNRPLIGSDAYSIQSPYGLPPSPFRGLVGGYDRMLNLALYERYMQLQMDMFPQNAGAPVFSSDGEFLGLLAAETDDQRINSEPTLTFAITNETVADVVQDLMEFRYRPRGALGLKISKHDPNAAALLIEEIEPGSAAEKSGLRVGDQILRFNDRTTSRVWDLWLAMERTKPGQTVNMLVNRNGQYEDIQVTLGSYGVPPEGILEHNNSLINPDFQPGPANSPEKTIEPDVMPATTAAPE